MEKRRPALVKLDDIDVSPRYVIRIFGYRRSAPFLPIAAQFGSAGGRGLRFARLPAADGASGAGNGGWHR